jgi:hypothetical protein
MDNRTVESEVISRCRKIIKENTGVFSQFKDMTNFIVSVMISLHSEPETVFKGAVRVYNMLKAEGFHSSHYLVLAATTIALQSDPFQYQTIVTTAKKHYDAMKDEHKFITSSDDYGIAALLAMTDKSVSQAIREMENCYRILKQDFSSSNAVQSLSQVLTFSDVDKAIKCRRVLELHHALKNRKCKLGYGMELSFLGVLTLLDEDLSLLADEIAESTGYLKNKKGFGYWSISTRERILFAAALVCNGYLTDTKKGLMETALSNNIIEILLAQQMAAITAATTASAAAASSAAN